MIKLLFVSALVSSVAALPRSRGEPIHRVIPAQSGRFQYNHHVPAAPRSNEGVLISPAPFDARASPQPAAATFVVDPNTLTAVRLDSPASAAQSNPQFTQPQVIPDPFNAQPVAPQQQGQANPSPYLSSAANQPVASPQNVRPRPPISNYIDPQTFLQQPPSPVNPQTLQYVNNPRSTSDAAGVAPVEIARRLIGNPPGGALLVGSNPPIFPIEKRLISNYTKLRPVVTDTFRCSKESQPNYAGYGYYADVENECQIFHVCLPWKELFPNQFAQDVTYQFSFICPNQTVFSQDSMTCTWESEALPCELSPELYWMNDNFFRKIPKEDGTGMKYADVNTKINPGEQIIYDYEDYNKKD